MNRCQVHPRTPPHDDPPLFYWGTRVIEAVALLGSAVLIVAAFWAFCALLFALAPGPHR